LGRLTTSRFKAKMKKIKGIFVGITIWMLVQGADVARATMTYGNGYYTNLCDGGVSANYYNCNPDCDPGTGSCKSINQGVVKWTCKGKVSQCLEDESAFSNTATLDDESCGYSQQISLFDKKCRKSDETWDNTCNLLGYMVWYGGDCGKDLLVVSGSPDYATQFSATPTATMLVLPTVAVAKQISGYLASLSTSISPTGIPTPTTANARGACGSKCGQTSQCSLGFVCSGGVCRNPACTGDVSCFCQGSSASSAAVVSTGSATPKTGVETWLGMIMMTGLGIGGWKLRKLSGKFWA
jgi:hypothetical protein